MLDSARVEKSGLPCEGTGYRSSKGQLAVWRPSSDILIARMSGHGDKGFVGPIVQLFDQIMKSTGKAQIFFDLERMASYDSELRTQLTARFYVDRTRIAAFHVLVVSKLTTMGVSVANLALGGILTPHSRRSAFALALDKALEAAGVKEFSSSIVAAA